MGATKIGMILLKDQRMLKGRICSSSLQGRWSQIFSTHSELLKIYQKENNII